MEDDPLDAAMRRVEEGADRIERQARLVFWLERDGHPLAPEARRLLDLLRDAQTTAVRYLVAEEGRLARS